MKFRWSGLEVEAAQWFKNGDHPLDYESERPGISAGDITTFTGAECREKGWEGEVVRYYRHPRLLGGLICPFCGSKMDDHGWLDFPPQGQPVCPGDWVITLPVLGAAAKLMGRFRAVSNLTFRALAFRPLVEDV